MMVIVGHLRLAGFFRWAGAAVARRATTPHRLLAGLIALSGALSALFVNDTICLALTPLVLEVTSALGIRATPYLLALATASNIGSTATLTGNPQNMIIGVASRIPYAAFFGALLPVAAVGLVAGLFVVVGAARAAGLTARLFELLHAREVHSVLSLSVVSAALSNLVSNVPAVMLFVPLVPELPDPQRAWLALAMSSTLAGNLTLVGSIANLIVAEGARKVSPLTFGEYLKVGLPVTLLTLAAGVFILS